MNILINRSESQLQTVTMLVGLSGSGKSTIANKLPGVIISSDTIRKNLLHNEEDQTHNDLVFKTYHEMLFNMLSAGKDCILDATNLSYKDRKKSIDIIKNFRNVKLKAYIINTPYLTCIQRDKERDRSVGEKVIQKQRAKFQIPTFEEGFDEIIIEEGIKKDSLYSLYTFMVDKDINNSHHIQPNLYKHCSETQKIVGEYTTDSAVILAASLHDYGDIFCETFDDDNEGHYYSHHNIGAYQLLSSDLFRIDSIERLDALFYINYHMEPFNWDRSDTAKQKFIKKFGINKTTKLEYLHKADMEAR